MLLLYQTAINHVCRAVNDCFGVTPPPRLSLVRSAASKTSPEEAAAAAAEAAAETAAAETAATAAVDVQIGASGEDAVQERKSSGPTRNHPACVRPASILIEKMKNGANEEEKKEEEGKGEEEEMLDISGNKVDEGFGGQVSVR